MCVLCCQSVPIYDSWFLSEAFISLPKPLTSASYFLRAFCKISSDFFRAFKSLLRCLLASMILLRFA